MFHPLLSPLWGEGRKGGEGPVAAVAFALHLLGSLVRQLCLDGSAHVNHFYFWSLPFPLNQGGSCLAVVLCWNVISGKPNFQKMTIKLSPDKLPPCHCLSLLCFLPELFVWLCHSISESKAHDYIHSNMSFRQHENPRRSWCSSWQMLAAFLREPAFTLGPSSGAAHRWPVNSFSSSLPMLCTPSFWSSRSCVHHLPPDLHHVCWLKTQSRTAPCHLFIQLFNCLFGCMLLCHWNTATRSAPWSVAD